ncbi:MAG: HD domain-containing protein [Deltaproteobacteria bacterium]|nr:HD domain-containing protein [Deltaproteobacteria bacterium]
MGPVSTIGGQAASAPLKTRGFSGFFPVNLELLPLDLTLDFGLYVSAPQAGRVLFAAPNDPPDKSTRRRLIKNKVPLFALTEDREKYRLLLEEHLRQMIQNPGVDDTSAAHLAYHLSLHTMETVFDQPTPENLSAAEEAIKDTADLIMSRDQALFALLEMTRRDDSHYIHSCNVAMLGLGLAKTLINVGHDLNLHAIAAALLFHDLGKIPVGFEILNKSETLTAEEWDRIREHPRLGYEMIQQSQMATEEARLVLLQHHERLDGSGYPLGLRGGQVHLFGRICAIADVFDAMTSSRPYKDHLSSFEAALGIRDQMSGQLDQKLVTLFITMFLKRTA